MLRILISNINLENAYLGKPYEFTAEELKNAEEINPRIYDITLLQILLKNRNLSGLCAAA
jgi:hypothetical protein